MPPKNQGNRCARRRSRPEPVLTGVTIGTRMTAGPILTNPGAPDISSEFLEAAGAATSHAVPLDVWRPRTHGRRRNHPRFQCCSMGNSRWYTGSACRRARRTRLSAPLPCLPTSPPSGWTRHRSCVWPACRPASPSRTENSPRMREPGSASCSANAETSTTSCPRPRTDIPRHLSERPVPVYDGSGRLRVLKCAPKRQVCALKDANGLVCVAMCADTSFRRALTNANGPTRGNVRAHHSAVRRDSAD